MSIPRPWASSGAAIVSSATSYVSKNPARLKGRSTRRSCGVKSIRGRATLRVCELLRGRLSRGWAGRLSGVIGPRGCGCEPEGITLGVTAHGECFARVDHLAAGVRHLCQSGREVRYREIGERLSISWAGAPGMDTECRTARVGLPALALTGPAVVKLHAKDRNPEVSRSLRIVRRELDKRDGRRRHDREGSRGWTMPGYLGFV
jgi:hypothetical protein